MVNGYYIVIRILNKELSAKNFKMYDGIRCS